MNTRTTVVREPAIRLLKGAKQSKQNRRELLLPLRRVSHIPVRVVRPPPQVNPEHDIALIVRDRLIHLRDRPERPRAVALNEHLHVLLRLVRGDERLDLLARALVVACELPEHGLVLGEDGLHRAQPVELPLLQSLERLLDALLEAEARSVELAHGNTVLLICVVRLAASADVGGLAVTRKRLGHKASKAPGAVHDVLRQW